MGGGRRVLWRAFWWGVLECVCEVTVERMGWERSGQDWIGEDWIGGKGQDRRGRERTGGRGGDRTGPEGKGLAVKEGTGRDGRGADGSGVERIGVGSGDDGKCVVKMKGIMKIKLDSIVDDASIQCRVAFDPEVIEEYSEAMIEGSEFPPIELFGTEKECWIGDGWHRYMAARKCGFKDISATLKSGGRSEALKCALQANAKNGLKRSNADKRRSVEVAR